jgi:hypothetical protein
MRAITTIRRDVFGAFFTLALASQTPLRAAEQFEGIWAKTQAERLDEEGPNSRTLIDLGNVIDDKPAPVDSVRIARKGAIETPDQEDVVRQAKTIL